MCLINVAHEHFITDASKMSEQSLANIMGPWGRGPKSKGLESRARKSKYLKQANLKSKLPRGCKTEILDWNM